MLRTKLAKKKLTKKLQKHLTENGVNSMKDFEETLAHQRMMVRDWYPKHKSTIMVCSECFKVAERLGMKEKCYVDFNKKKKS